MYFHVRREEEVSRKWRNNDFDAPRELGKNKLKKLGKNKLKKMTSRVFWQAIHYEMVFYATWTFPTVCQTFYHFKGNSPRFGMLLAISICTPLAGFFNFTI